MIQPASLLDHARRLAGAGKGRPPEVDLRRGVSAAYYAVFHEITARAAHHLISAADAASQNAIRRTWTHGEVQDLAKAVVARAKVVTANPGAPLTKEHRKFGPLIDLCAADPDLVEALRLFEQLQTQRHRADYDHSAVFDKAGLLSACQDAETALNRLAGTGPAAQQALCTALALQRADFTGR